MVTEGMGIHLRQKHIYYPSISNNKTVPKEKNVKSKCYTFFCNSNWQLADGDIFISESNIDLV